MVLDEDARVRMRVNGGDWLSLSVKELPGQVKAVQADAQDGANAVPVIISARKDIRYESVVHVMDVLQRAGVARVGLSVRTTGG